jgi:polysaccharide pyruvyl transferase WcaK-like protein
VLKRLDNRHRPPHEDLKLFAQSAAVVAMRYHSLVFALGTGTPCLAIDYTLGGKVSGLADELGCRDRVVELRRFDGVAAAERILAGLEQPPALSAEIGQTAEALERTFERLLPRSVQSSSPHLAALGDRPA